MTLESVKDSKPRQRNTLRRENESPRLTEAIAREWFRRNPKELVTDGTLVIAVAVILARKRRPRMVMLVRLPIRKASKEFHRFRFKLKRLMTKMKTTSSLI